MELRNRIDYSIIVVSVKPTFSSESNQRGEPSIGDIVKSEAVVELARYMSLMDGTADADFRVDSIAWTDFYGSQK